MVSLHYEDQTTSSFWDALDEHGHTKRWLPMDDSVPSHAPVPFSDLSPHVWTNHCPGGLPDAIFPTVVEIDKPIISGEVDHPVHVQGIDNEPGFCFELPPLLEEEFPPSREETTECVERRHVLELASNLGSPDEARALEGAVKQAIPVEVPGKPETQWLLGAKKSEKNAVNLVAEFLVDAFRTKSLTDDDIRALMERAKPLLLQKYMTRYLLDDLLWKRIQELVCRSRNSLCYDPVAVYLRKEYRDVPHESMKRRYSRYLDRLCLPAEFRIRLDISRGKLHLFNKRSYIKQEHQEHQAVRTNLMHAKRLQMPHSLHFLLTRIRPRSPKEYSVAQDVPLFLMIAQPLLVEYHRHRCSLEMLCFRKEWKDLQHMLQHFCEGTIPSKEGLLFCSEYCPPPFATIRAADERLEPTAKRQRTTQSDRGQDSPTTPFRFADLLSLIPSKRSKSRSDRLFYFRTKCYNPTISHPFVRVLLPYFQEDQQL